MIRLEISRHPIFPTYDYGIPGYEFGSLARSVYYNAFAHLRAERGKTECGQDLSRIILYHFDKQIMAGDRN